MATPRLRLGQLLVDAKLIAPEALDEALALQRADGRRLGTLLVERGFINETQLTQILSHQLSVPWVSLLHIEFSRQLLNLVPYAVVDAFCLLPIYVRHVRGQGDTLYVAMDDPTNEDGLRACREHSGLPVRAMIAPPHDIRNAMRVYYGVERPRSSVVEPPATADTSLPAEPDTALDQSSVSAVSGVAPIAETAVAETAVVEAAVVEAAVVETAVVETAVVETAVVETAVVETAVVEPLAVDTSVAPVVPDPLAHPASWQTAHEVAADLAAVSSLVDEPLPLVTRSVRPPLEPPAAVDESARAETSATAQASPPDPDAAHSAKARAASARLRALLAPPSAPRAPSEPPVESLPQPRGRAPRMVSLTLLDGTTITLPAKRAVRSQPPPESAADGAAASSSRDDEAPLRSEPPGPDELHGLTARDLVTALRAVSHGADASEVLGPNVRWEAMFAALLSLLLKKHLIADWEFVEELKKF